MKGSHSPLRELPLSLRQPSVSQQPAGKMPVGRSCTISKSCMGKPVRLALALPSLVQVLAGVHDC